VPFDHNDHYHRLILRQVRRDCARAMDVGCGTGGFAFRLAETGVEVDAIDRSAEVIAVARDRSERRPGSAIPNFERGDVTELALPAGHYDFVSCLASIHHMPFSTVSALRAALAPGGVLVILGCYPERTPVDLAWSAAAVPVNAAAKMLAAVADSLRPADSLADRVPVRAPVMPPDVSLSRIRREAEVLLPGCTVRRLLFWRYLLVFRNGERLPG